jgi:hypothetical protein
MQVESSSPGFRMRQLVGEELKAALLRMFPENLSRAQRLERVPLIDESGSPCKLLTDVVDRLVERGERADEDVVSWEVARVAGSVRLGQGLSGRENREDVARAIALHVSWRWPAVCGAAGVEIWRAGAGRGSVHVLLGDSRRALTVHASEDDRRWACLSHETGPGGLSPRPSSLLQTFRPPSDGGPNWEWGSYTPPWPEPPATDRGHEVFTLKTGFRARERMRGLRLRDAEGRLCDLFTGRVDQLLGWSDGGGSRPLARFDPVPTADTPHLASVGATLHPEVTPREVAFAMAQYLGDMASDDVRAACRETGVLVFEGDGGNFELFLPGLRRVFVVHKPGFDDFIHVNVTTANEEFYDYMMATRTELQRERNGQFVARFGFLPPEGIVAGLARLAVGDAPPRWGALPLEEPPGKRRRRVAGE